MRHKSGLGATDIQFLFASFFFAEFAIFCYQTQTKYLWKDLHYTNFCYTPPLSLLCMCCIHTLLSILILFQDISLYCYIAGRRKLRSSSSCPPMVARQQPQGLWSSWQLCEWFRWRSGRIFFSSYQFLPSSLYFSLLIAALYFFCLCANYLFFQHHITSVLPALLKPSKIRDEAHCPLYTH